MVLFYLKTEILGYKTPISGPVLALPEALGKPEIRDKKAKYSQMLLVFNDLVRGLNSMKKGDSTILDEKEG